jgi:hypothetical protein
MKMSKKMKRKILRSALILAVAIIKGAISLFIGWLSALWLVPAAAAERGYEGAYGGEWFLIIGSFVITYWALTVGVEKWLSSPGGEIREVQTVPQGTQKS